MKTTVGKVIFSSIYTILIALVVTYICHRELEPTPSVNYEKSQDAIAYLSDIQNHTHSALCTENYSFDNGGTRLMVWREGAVVLDNHQGDGKPREMHCYDRFGMMTARIVGESWGVFCQCFDVGSGFNETFDLYLNAFGLPHGVASNPRATFGVNPRVDYQVVLDNGYTGCLTITQRDITIEFDEANVVIHAKAKYGQIRDFPDSLMLATTRDLMDSRAAFEEIAVRLQALDIQSGDTRDILTNLITILKDCSSK